MAAFVAAVPSPAALVTAVVLRRGLGASVLAAAVLFSGATVAAAIFVAGAFVTAEALFTAASFALAPLAADFFAGAVVAAEALLTAASFALAPLAADFFAGAVVAAEAFLTEASFALAPLAADFFAGASAGDSFALAALAADIFAGVLFEGAWVKCRPPPHCRRPANERTIDDLSLRCVDKAGSRTLACIKPPVTHSVGKTAIIGVTRPAFASGPTARSQSSSAPGRESQQQSARPSTPHPNRAPEVRAAADRAEQAVRSAQGMSLEALGAAKKDAQRALSAARRDKAPQTEISRLENAVKDLQRAEGRKRAERDAQQRETADRDRDASRWLTEYLGSTTGPREVVEVVVDGFTYLYDSTSAPAAHEAANRVVAVRGHSGGEHGPRDTNRMRGHPNPNRVDRGHLVARAIGGGYDLNLIPQDPKLNRGHSEPGKVWRELETYLSKNPGTEFFVRPTYSDTSDYPTQLEFGVELESGEWRVETFDNQPPSEDS